MSVQLKKRKFEIVQEYEVEYWSCGLDCKGHFHMKKERAKKCTQKQHRMSIKASKSNN